MASVDDQIRDLLRQISSLEWQINSLRSQKRASEEKKRTFETRKGQVKSVKNNLERSFDGYVSSIRRNQNAAKDKIASATAGMKHESTLVSAIQGDSERDTESDKFGSQMHSNLSREIQRCDQEISNANNEMNDFSRRENSLVNQRAQLVTRAKNLSATEGATIKVYLSTRY